MRVAESGFFLAKRIPACASAALLFFNGIAQAKGIPEPCATAAEITAIQVSAVQQELTDAALACGDKEQALFNRFQTVFNKELRRSDALMLSMFKRLDGVVRGNAAYDAYKTRAIAHAEQRRTVPGAAENFCKTADIVFAAALAPDKPVLEDFVAGVPVDESSPVDSCEIKVGMTLQGVAAGPDVMPTPRPDLPGRFRPIKACFRKNGQGPTLRDRLLCEVPAFQRAEAYAPARRSCLSGKIPRAISYAMEGVISAF